MNIEIVHKKAGQVTADLIVIPVVQGGETAGAVRELGGDVRDALAKRIATSHFEAKAGKTLSLQSEAGDLLLVGMGKSKDAEAWRTAVARSRPVAAAMRAKTVAVCVGGGAGSQRLVAPVLEGFLLAGYRFDKYRSEKENGYEGPGDLSVVGPTLSAGRATRAIVERTNTVCEAVCFARDLINEMSTVKTPTYLGKTARQLARGTGMTCEVWQGEKLRKERMNGILAVSAGSAEPGAFIAITYKPKRTARGVVALVGKGITFDSGGLSLKPPKAMEWMKQDMSGAAAVLAVMKAVAVLQPQVEVRGYVASAENLPGSGAQKPGDVITYRNGTTAEVLNTDAEGRLVLGDALCVASEGKPDVIIDLATLTGACMVALGTKLAGVMGNDQALVNTLLKHGRDSGDGLWQLPLVEDYMEDIKSSIADIQNIGSGYAGTITAGLFLRCFVGETKWAHLDIAGPAFAEKPLPLAPDKGATGFGVRLLLSYLDSF